MPMQNTINILRACWVIGIVISVSVLAFYRSDAGHGPDMVGQEVAAFVCPLLFSLACIVFAVVLSTLARRSIEWRRVILGVIILIFLGIIEGAIYSLFVMR